MSDQALAVMSPADAKAQALKIIEGNKGCVSYVRPEDLNTAALFVPVVSVIMPTKDDFYDPIPGVGIMAKPQLVNLLREKAGVNVLRTVTDKRGEWIWIAHVFGNRRQPDGTMLEDDASYEFDAEKRAELDAINQPQKYGSEVAKRRHLLELAKFGEQRAVTGAQHALIHKLAHVARSFKNPEELMRGMIVLRIDRNVDGLLRDPQMRTAVIQHALGARDAIYGPEHDVTPAKAALDAPREPAAAEAVAQSAQEPAADDFGEPPQEQPPFAKPAAPAAAPPDPRIALRKQLAAMVENKGKREVLSKWKGKATGRLALDLINGLLTDEEATAEELQLWIDRCAKIGGGAA